MKKKNEKPVVIPWIPIEGIPVDIILFFAGHLTMLGGTCPQCKGKIEKFVAKDPDRQYVGLRRSCKCQYSTMLAMTNDIQESQEVIRKKNG